MKPVLFLLAERSELSAVNFTFYQYAEINIILCAFGKTMDPSKVCRCLDKRCLSSVPLCLCVALKADAKAVKSNKNS